MNGLLNELARSVVQKNSAGECSVEDLEQLVNQFPYFSAAHLLLAKKIESGEQFKKASLFFYNPLWLQYLLQNPGNAEIIKEETAAEKDFIPATDPSDPVKTEEPVNSAAPVSITVAILKPVDISTLKIEPADPSKAKLLFEPYYTVDYFASQGIRFKEEDKPKDKFGQQLKSFTEWLKAMKRLPPEADTSASPTSIEQKVEQMAEHSLQDRDVVTEAMAEVWEKQGNAAKAAEIYGKLSLLDPSKSRYFAAKIGDLKKIN
jgi:hypothetical protein